MKFFLTRRSLNSSKLSLESGLFLLHVFFLYQTPLRFRIRNAGFQAGDVNYYSTYTNRFQIVLMRMGKVMVMNFFRLRKYQVAPSNFRYDFFFLFSILQTWGSRNYRFKFQAFKFLHTTEIVSNNYRARFTVQCSWLKGIVYVDF